MSKPFNKGYIPTTTNLTHEQIEDLLENVLEVPKMNSWKGDKIQFCCPVHNESNPSMGINADLEGKQVCHCFSCGFSGSLPWLLFKAKEYKFKSYGEAIHYFNKRYNVNFGSEERERKKVKVKRYGEQVEEKSETEVPVISKVKLAPFKSGKETFKAFYDKGFSKDDVKKYMIGRDLDNKTYTMPVFNQNKELVGIIGRFVKKMPHNHRFHIYDNFRKGDTVYGLDHYVPSQDTVIVVESQTDCMMLHKWGVHNVVALMGGTISRKQVDIIFKLGSKVLLLADNDKGGKILMNLAKKMFKNKCRMLPFTYPTHGKDPIEWGKEATLECIKNAGKVKTSKYRYFT